MLTKLFSRFKKEKAPVVLMQESIKKAKKEIDKLQEHFLLLQTDLIEHEDTVLEKKNEKDRLIEEARSHKQKNDPQASQNSLRLALKIEAWIEKVQSSISDLRMKSYEIKEYATKVNHSIENYQLEINLIQSSFSMSQYKLDEYNDFLNLDDMNNLIQEANNYLDIMNAKINTNEDLHKISQSHKKPSISVDSELIVKDLYNKL